MENKVKVWLVRDMNGSLYLSQIKPKKEKFDWVIENPEYTNNYVKIDANNFPSVKWEDDEPTEAYITLAEPQEQPKQEQPTPKQEIDWEQRRYEIAKEMMYKIYRQEVAVSNRGQGIILKDIADIAVAFADTLIKELKEKSE